MNANNLYSETVRYFTKNGASTLESCGVSSAGKGVILTISGLAEGTPEGTLKSTETA